MIQGLPVGLKPAGIPKQNIHTLLPYRVATPGCLLGKVPDRETSNHAKTLLTLEQHEQACTNV